MLFALRQLIKSPGFSVVALLTLALGIGVNTIAFTVLNRFLFQSLPYAEPDRLVQILGTSAQSRELDQSPGDYFDEREQNTVFQSIAAYYVNYQASLTEPGKSPTRSVTMAVSQEFFSLFGIQPALGRLFTTEDVTKGENVTVLSNAYWRKHYNMDPQVLGKTIHLDGKVTTIVGVMPTLLDDPLLFSGNMDMWYLDHLEVNRTFRDKGWYRVAARLKPGVSLSQAQAEMSSIATRLAHDFPKSNADRGLAVRFFPSDSMDPTTHRITWLIMDLALVVLLIACVNLANLQLVRTTGRAKEIAIRLALGAKRSALMRMLLAENVLLSIAGGALGLFVAKWGTTYLANFFDIPMPLDLRVMGFTLIISAATGALFGAMPAWIASTADVNQTLKQSGRSATADRSRHRLRNALIVVEVAMALTLLSGAGYFIRGIERLTHREFGWRTDNVLTGLFSLPHERYGEERDDRSRIFAEQFQAALQALPGVETAAISSGTPAFGLGYGSNFIVDGQTPPPRGTEPIAFNENITPGFFSVYDIHVIQGRDFTPSDGPTATRVVIINQALAKKYWPGESALGKRIGNPDPARPEWAEIVGVVNDISTMGDIGPNETHFEIYQPWAQNSFRFLTFNIHTTKDVRTIEDGARQVLAKFEPDIAITYLDTVEHSMERNMAGFRLVRRMLTLIGLLGLLLSAVGIYGVIANLASERTQEIGIRMALGAQPTDVRWLFLSNGLRLSAVGTGLGLIFGFGLMMTLNKILPIIPGNDPWVVIAMAILLVVVVLMACWIPARRATKVNPMIALRAD